MAISVKDIQEKEFSQVSSGYNMEQVDDFLDELAEQLGAMIRENLALTAQVQQLEEKAAALAAEKEELAKKLPDYNETGYFKNLESAMRESLIGAQRIADETIAEAKKRAEQMVEDASAVAEKTVADANAKAGTLMDEAEKLATETKAEAAHLRAISDTYRANFKKLVEEQMAALAANEELLK